MLRAGAKVQAKNLVLPSAPSRRCSRSTTAGADKNLEKRPESAAPRRGTPCWAASQSKAAPTRKIRTFYSCLFRANLFSHQVLQRTRDAEAAWLLQPLRRQGYAGYMADNGFWDTFRSQFPLTSILHPTMQGRYMNALLAARAIKRVVGVGEDGRHDRWLHAISLLTDAWAKRAIHVRPRRRWKLQGGDEQRPGRCQQPAGWKRYWQLGYVSYPGVAWARQLNSSGIIRPPDDFCGYQLARMTGNKF